MVEQYDLEDQQDAEQFDTEEDEIPSNEVRRFLKEQKLYEKQKKKEESKHKARFTRVENQNGYICDHCEKPYVKDEGSLIYSKYGEFAYCKDCLKELYPDYKPVRLAGTIDKLNYRSNHCDTQYYSRIK